MALVPGARLGPYEIVSLVGAGGMGEVYKAKDTRLDRTVAIKILPPQLAADPQFRERFDREARTISQLDHPNICALHDVGEQGGMSFLVMQYLEGETLADRLAKGALPLDQALQYAIQIADALDKAHRAGIIHRDLKPGNIFLTKAGAKLLDFGLAKTRAPAIASAGASMLPTTPPNITAQGTILGTFQYMAPEQIEGVEADARTDLFAFGCVLFEMLTGKKAFEGKTRASLIGAILKDEPPPVSQVQPVAPASLNRIVATCLAKDPDDRWQTARDLMHELTWVADGGALIDSTARTPSPAASRSAWSHALPWALVAILSVALLSGLLAWSPWRSAPLPTRKLLASIGADASLPTDVGASAILSPDGTTLVFVGQHAGQTRLFVRKLDQLPATILAGTEGAANPFFSPGGEWIAFFAGGKLKKVSMTGGASVTLCDASVGRGGTWTDDDTIIFTPNNGYNTTLVRVSAGGGTPAAFGLLSKGASTQRWPQALPGGKTVLYSEHSSTTNWDGANLVVVRLAGGTPKIVVRGGYYGRYVPSGHLVYMQQGTLFAVRFDLDRLETVGQAVPAVEGLIANPVATGGAQLALSSEGTLVYVPGVIATTPASAINWMTRDGQTSVLRATKAVWANPRFSPDGQKLALEILDDKRHDIWVYEWARDTLTQLTFDPSEHRLPVWTPDGRRIVFASDRAQAGVYNLYWVNADGTGDVTRLTDSRESQYPVSWHFSGKFLAFDALRATTWYDLMILPVEGDAARGWTSGNPTVFLSTHTAAAPFGMFSPDGRWIAYQSNEAGTSNISDVYVRPFPGPGGRWRVSTEGGLYPQWSTAAHELLFATPIQARVMFAPYAVAGDSFRADKPQVWSPTGIRLTGFNGGSPFDLHPDGKRLATFSASDQSNVSQDKVVFVFNFFDYLRKIAPGAK
jgi:serine/threonine protein kinase/Tol biopolymer transport system component